MAKKENRIEIKSMPGLVAPLFSDAIHISVTVKQENTKAKNKQRAGFVRLTFMDTIRQQILSEIVIDHMHARDLLKVLDANVKALDQAVKKGKMPKKAKEKSKTETKARYIN